MKVSLHWTILIVILSQDAIAQVAVPTIVTTAVKIVEISGEIMSVYVQSDFDWLHINGIFEVIVWNTHKNTLINVKN